MCFSNDHQNQRVVYIDPFSFEAKSVKLAEFGEENVCFCYFGIFQQQSRLLNSRNRYFANTYELYPCYFEHFVKIHVLTISKLVCSNFEENFICNWQADGFDVEKGLFAAF